MTSNDPKKNLFIQLWLFLDNLDLESHFLSMKSKTKLLNWWKLQMKTNLNTRTGSIRLENQMWKSYFWTVWLLIAAQISFWRFGNSFKNLLTKKNNPRQSITLWLQYKLSEMVSIKSLKKWKFYSFLMSWKIFFIRPKRNSNI